MRRPVANSKTKEAVQDETELLDRLKAVAESVGLDVREEKLVGGAGYSVRSGICRVNGKDTVMLDRNLPLSERTDVLATALSKMDLDTVYMEPDLRRVILRTPEDDDNEETGSS